MDDQPDNSLLIQNLISALGPYYISDAGVVGSVALLRATAQQGIKQAAPVTGAASWLPAEAREATPPPSPTPPLSGRVFRKMFR